MIYFAYAMAWISTSVAVVAGMYFTKSAWCLWAFVLPACIELTHKQKGKEESGVAEDEQSKD